MEEKLRILKMVENGQISATEAAQLLQAIGDGGGGASHAPPPPPMPAPPPPPRADDTRYGGYNTNEGGSGPPPAGTSLEDLGKKFESFARGAAPKVERFAESLASTIAGAADKFSEAFVQHADAAERSDHGQAHRPHEPKRAPSPSGGGTGTTEKQVEVLVETSGHNELSLSGLGGEVRVKGYNGDKITARLTYRAKRTNAPIELVKLGGKHFLKYEPDDFTMVAIDAYVPERAFSVIKIDGMNGALDVSSLTASDMRFSNANGSTSLVNLSANTIKAEASNGRFLVSRVAADNAAFENLNGLMETDELDIAKLVLQNHNGALSLIMSRFARFTDYIWAVETGNAKLSINLPSAHDLGYHIKAHAAMGEIRLGLTGMQHLINEQSLVEARSVSYNTAPRKIKMTVETSNAPLLIN